MRVGVVGVGCRCTPVQLGRTPVLAPLRPLLCQPVEHEPVRRVHGEKAFELLDAWHDTIVS